MKTELGVRLMFPSFLLVIILVQNSCHSSEKNVEGVEAFEILHSNESGVGQAFTFEFSKGESHNHPTFAIWLEDTAGNYIQTIFVTKAIATGIFDYGGIEDGKWVKGQKRRPAALPVWSHKRGLVNEEGFYYPTPENPVPDVFTGATPQSSFILKAYADSILPDQYWVKFEVNQTWDWNEYWTNNKFPEDEDYKTSSQPALVYGVLIDAEMDREFIFNVLGHSHYSGKNGEISEDISTMTTALQIFDMINLKLK